MGLWWDVIPRLIRIDGNDIYLAGRLNSCWYSEIVPQKCHTSLLDVFKSFIIQIYLGTSSGKREFWLGNGSERRALESRSQVHILPKHISMRIQSHGRIRKTAELSTFFKIKDLWTFYSLSFFIIRWSKVGWGNGWKSWIKSMMGWSALQSVYSTNIELFQDRI